MRPIFMTAACGILAISTGACSKVLGIDDPKPGDGGMGDGPPTGADRLTLNLTSAQLGAIAQGQRVQLRATAVYPDGSMQDASSSATYESSAPTVASVPSPGQLEGGSQTGMATITVRFGSATPATLAVTVSSKPCQPKINEFQTGSATSSSDEWVEIVNPCTGPIDMTGWTLVYRSAGTTGTGATDGATVVNLTGSIPAGEFRLYAGTDFSGTATVTPDGLIGGGSGGTMGQSAGALAIRMGAKDVGPIADAVAYGSVTAGNPFIEGNPLPTMSNGRPAQRVPYDGRDADDGGADFALVAAGSKGTPRAPNAP